MVNWLIYCSFIFSMIMTLLGLFLDLTYHLKFETQLETLQSRQVSGFDEYQEMLNHFQDHSVLSPMTPDGLDFNIQIAGVREDNRSELLVKEGKIAEVLSWGKNWPEERHLIQSNPAIDKLFIDIEKFTHWTIGAENKNQVANQLIVGSQLFIADTYFKDPTAVQVALKKTRHLSRILLSTEDLNIKRAGLSLLEKELDFMDFLKTQIRHSPLIWTPILPAELNRYRQYLNSTSHLLSYTTPPSLLKKVFLGEKAPTGFCAILVNRLPSLHWSHAFMQKQFLFEPNFLETGKILETIEERGQETCVSSFEKRAIPQNFAQYIPYYRRIYGMKFILQATQNKDFL